MYNFNKISKSFTISLLAYDGKFSYRQGGDTFTNISSYQLKRFLDKQWDENLKLEEYIKSLNIDWSTGWLMADDTIIEKPYAKTIECVYWQYSSKNNGFIEGISLTVLAWSDGKQTIPIRFMVYEKDLEQVLRNVVRIVDTIKHLESKFFQVILVSGFYTSAWIMFF